ncbi:enoyl-ACP reductase FabI [Rhodohalobacter sulfatireducens]|uniref:Enoyl-[acyl-carrier-protein] reductase [NADH] n=1 Tax=Rhodohalobacter sulfatireducens TaxID=2911366 RepID=A0ABS9K8R0_9BACT|nr:enoyl-ACP reductase [Rhodohalobacter sulfatireducens]MCG2587197.1 enoyl-ACP reductase [Rhodohalobacter sulfatireducens]
MSEQQGYGLLKGKKGIIFGALDKRSIAWRIALACKREGADFVLSNAPIALRLGALDELSEKTDAKILPCDVSKEEEVEGLMKETKEELGSVDFILHAIGMSPNVRKKIDYKNLNYDWYNDTLDISAISLHKVLHFAEKTELLNNGASIVALSYIGAQRIFSKYSDMNDAKALLESIARNYGSRLADRGIRVNTVSQAPTKTSAGTGIKGFDGMYTFADKIAPLGNPTADECADYCVTLFSDLTRKVTMQNLYHDGGFVTSGISEEMIDGLVKLYAEEDDSE